MLPLSAIFGKATFKIVFLSCWAPKGKRILRIQYLGLKKSIGRKKFRFYVTRRALHHIKNRGGGDAPLPLKRVTDHRNADRQTQAFFTV